jgi:hypothetical protein
MKRRLWLAFAVVPVLAFGLASDVAASESGGDRGEGARTLTAILNGANEVPPATTSDLRGTARITINRAHTQLCWDLDYTTTQVVVAAHIHKGPAGVAAPVVFGFFNPPTSAVVVNDGCRAGDPALLTDIAKHPGAYYVNVHTTAHPGGAGRGQLTKKHGNEGDDSGE